MAEFDWINFLKQHALFSGLGEAKIKGLLEDSVSTEVSISENQVLIKEGDLDDSLYLIGRGAVEVLLKVSHGQDVVVNNLKVGDIVGEMALVERRPRSATAIAKESSVLLKFDNHAFEELLQTQPEIGFRMLVKLSERLRDMGDNILVARLKDVEDKISHVNSKLDTEIKVVDVALKATQTIFDQTSKRATEVIDTAERRSKYLKNAGSILGTILAIVTGVLGFWGVNFKSTLDSELRTLQESSVKAGELSQKFELLEAHTAGLTAKIEKQYESVNDNKEFISKVFFPRMQKAMLAQFHIEVSADFNAALDTYNSILSFEDEKINDRLYRTIIGSMFNDEKKIKHYVKVLKARIDDRSKPASYRQKILSYYLLLSAFALNADPEYAIYLDYFKVVIENEKTIKDEETVANFGSAIFEEYISLVSEDAGEQKEKTAKIKKIWTMFN